MGRGKLQLKRIEDKSSRHVTFSKRRTGLIKKAKELSVLCDVDVAVFVFSGKGKLYQFTSGDCLRKILGHFQIQNEGNVACASISYSEKVPARQLKIGSDAYLLQTVQRYLEDQKVEQLDMADLTQLEHKLDATLHQIRMKKSQLMREAVTALHKKEKQLREGNQSKEKEVQNPGIVDENMNPPQVDDMGELYASASAAGANENDIPLHLQPFYLL